MSIGSITIGPATAGHLGAINDIYNHYVAATAVTFDVEPKSMAWRREWFARFGERGRYRLLVATGEAGILGYTYSDRFRPRPAYEATVETSVYVAPEHVGRGVGSALALALVRELETEDVHRACAGIAMPNPASVRLHERLGYRRVGYFSEQGRKFGRYWDVSWYERRFPDESPAA
jgi:phosphinothricin acetyltransferase